MAIHQFSDPELYLLNNWASATLLERSVKAVRDKYTEILDSALDKVTERHKELDCRAIHLSDNWELTAGIGRKAWPSMYPRWPSGFWLGCGGLQNLTSMEGDSPYACVWLNPPKSAKLDLEEAVHKLKEAAKRLLSREQLERVEHSLGSGEADISYPLPEPRDELLNLLLKEDSRGFIDCIVAHYETLVRFMPVMDEIMHVRKRK